MYEQTGDVFWVPGFLEFCQILIETRSVSDQVSVLYIFPQIWNFAFQELLSPSGRVEQRFVRPSWKTMSPTGPWRTDWSRSARITVLTGGSSTLKTPSAWVKPRNCLISKTCIKCKRGIVVGLSFSQTAALKQRKYPALPSYWLCQVRSGSWSLVSITAVLGQLYEVSTVGIYISVTKNRPTARIFWTDTRSYLRLGTSTKPWKAAGLMMC